MLYNKTWHCLWSLHKIWGGFVTKSKAVFPTDDSLFKMLYLAMLDITKKWTGSRQDWAQIYPQLALYCSGRIPE